MDSIQVQLDLAVITVVGDEDATPAKTRHVLYHRQCRVNIDCQDSSERTISAVVRAKRPRRHQNRHASLFKHVANIDVVIGCGTVGKVLIIRSCRKPLSCRAKYRA